MLDRARVALVLFTLHNCTSALLMRYTQLHNRDYSSAVAVLLQETAVKLPCIIILFLMEAGGTPSRALLALRDDAIQHPSAWLHIAVPAVLYTLQNNSMYIGYAHIGPAMGMLIYQSKILWTAIFSVLLLGRQLSKQQWLAVALLATGVVCVLALSSTSSSTRERIHVDAKEMRHHHLYAMRHGHVHNSSHTHAYGISGRQLHSTQRSEVTPSSQNGFIGSAAFLFAALCTSGGSVYFESMIKARAASSASAFAPNGVEKAGLLWLRSLQLCIYASAIAATGVLLVPDRAITERGLLHGFGLLPWLCVVWNGAGGLIVAICMKHADNIRRSFAQGIAILLGAIGSYACFGLQLSAGFTIGASLILLANLLYADALRLRMPACWTGSLPSL